jgi:hypothetical protein
MNKGRPCGFQGREWTAKELRAYLQWTKFLFCSAFIALVINSASAFEAESRTGLSSVEPFNTLHTVIYSAPRAKTPPLKPLLPDLSSPEHLAVREEKSVALVTRSPAC